MSPEDSGPPWTGARESRDTSLVLPEFETAIRKQQISGRSEQGLARLRRHDNVPATPAACVRRNPAGQAAPAKKNQRSFAAPQLGVINEQIESISQNRGAQQTNNQAGRVVEQVLRLLLIAARVPRNISQLLPVTQLQNRRVPRQHVVAADDGN